MLPVLRPTARRLLSSTPAQLSMTSGAMYNWRVRAVEKALDRVGKAVGPLEVSDLSSLGHLDQYHYLGTEACDEVAELLGLGPGSTLLDIGSGIGGPARYLAATTGCSVVGVELQRDLYEASVSLTSRCLSINKLVSFVNADATGVHSLQLPFGLHGQFDHFMSLLVNLHIPDRRALHAGILPRIRPGGTFVIDDFAAVAPATAAEGRTLVDLVKAPSVTSVSAYVAELEDVGFVDVETVDMTAKWAHWTAARHTEYVAAEAEMVALHGRQIFENRSYFYSKIDELFAGGRVGGVRITGRRPGKAEAALIAGRKSRANKPTPQPVHLIENLATYCGASAPANPQAVTPPQVSLGAQPAVGAQTKRVVATQASAAEQLIGAASAQPPLPWLSPPQPGLHDSIQYHFFLGPLFIAVRVFHTATLQSSTAWLYDTSQPSMGPIELLNTYTPLQTGVGPGIVLEGEEMCIVDDSVNGATITLRPSNPKAQAVLQQAGVGRGSLGRPELRIEVEQGHSYGWMPAGFEGEADRPVIHRPAMVANVAMWRGVARGGFGYSKRWAERPERCSSRASALFVRCCLQRRPLESYPPHRYHGIYPRYNGWRFIHGVALTQDETFIAPPPRPLPLTSVPQGPWSAPSIVWTADATFGDDKYNYFKLLAPEAHESGTLLESAQADTYQQQDVAYGRIGGERVTASLKEIAKWHTIIGGRGGNDMEMKYENRLCGFTLQVGDKPPTTGLAYNERCFGCLW